MDQNILNAVIQSDDSDSNKDVVYILTDEFGHPIYGYPVE